ncbi:MAG TPA: M15 family metallopeptidase [Polyangia bacterium]|jgi:hypothetical protein
MRSGAARRHAVITAAVIGLAGAAGCSEHSDAGATTFAAAAPLPWVDPARCLPSCTHTVEPDLVTVDASARLAADGAYQLRADAQPALAALIAGAAAASLTVSIGDAHRTYDQQAMLWDQLSVSEPGRAARPGHSEHEAGLAVDLGFAPDAAGDWSAANAWQYGFVLSYPQGKQKTTGFRYEPWHFRFVGSAAAADLHARPGLTLEEWFRASPERGVSGDCSDCPLAGSRGACDGVSADGLCDATVLTWCFEGTLTQVDCTTSGLACEPDPATDGATCL